MCLKAEAQSAADRSVDHILWISSSSQSIFFFFLLEDDCGK